MDRKKLISIGLIWVSCQALVACIGSLPEEGPGGQQPPCGSGEDADDRCIEEMLAPGRIPRGPISVRKGDLVFLGTPLVSSDRPSYADQMLIIFMGELSRAAGLLEPFWGAEISTWDDTTYPTGERYVWSSVELVAADAIYTPPGGQRAVIVRPTPSLTQSILLEQTLQRYSSSPPGRTYPFWGIFLSWVKRAQESVGWMWTERTTAGVSEINPLWPHWQALYNLDLRALKAPQALQHSPFLDPALYSDISRQEFWQRDLSPSSRVAWSLMWGWFQKGGQAVRAQFLNNLPAVAAVDGIMPGQLAWWLTENGLGQVVNEPVSVRVSARIGSSPEEPWHLSVIGNAPLSDVSLRLRIGGKLNNVTVRVRCRAGGPVVALFSASLPLDRELESACDYSDAGWYQPEVTVQQLWTAIGRGEATVVATPPKVRVQRGDILAWGSPAQEPGAASYGTHTYLGFVSSAAALAGIYAPFWGEGFGTWDDGPSPLGKRAFFGHIEIAGQDETRETPAGFELVVLRPNDKMASTLNMDAAIAQRLSGVYSQPFFGALLRWLGWARSNVDWIASQPDLYQRWKAISGADLPAILSPPRLQHSPALSSANPAEHENLASPLFWQRDSACSSDAAWRLISGWYAKGGEAVRQSFAGRPEVTSAVDAVSPGQLGWWLVQQGYVDIAGRRAPAAGSLP